MDFVAVQFSLTDAGKIDLLIGRLTQLGCTGFQEEPGLLTASLPREALPGVEPELSALAAAEELSYTTYLVPWENWNLQWEQSFSPVRIGSFCGIRASFHAPMGDVTHQLIITPRMTFGTGHHATTASMIRLMEMMDLSGRSVLDFGTGTGILAILAARMGAGKITAVDNDPSAVENARENAAENAAQGRINFLTAGHVRDVPGQYDCILANIQLDVIMQNLGQLAGNLRPDGALLVSGILTTDRDRLLKAAKASGLMLSGEIRDLGWVAARFEKMEK